MKNKVRDKMAYVRPLTRNIQKFENVETPRRSSSDGATDKITINPFPSFRSSVY